MEEQEHGLCHALPHPGSFGDLYCKLLAIGDARVHREGKRSGQEDAAWWKSWRFFDNHVAQGRRRRKRRRSKRASGAE